jgi:hypothetical protein
MKSEWMVCCTRDGFGRYYYVYKIKNNDMPDSIFNREYTGGKMKHYEAVLTAMILNRRERRKHETVCTV